MGVFLSLSSLPQNSSIIQMAYLKTPYFSIDEMIITSDNKMVTHTL